jgi:hypothetical protein
MLFLIFWIILGYFILSYYKILLAILNQFSYSRLFSNIMGYSTLVYFLLF